MRCARHWAWPVSCRASTISFDGCHINRDIAQLVSDAGLALRGIEHPGMRAPRIAGFVYLGRAVRPRPAAPIQILEQP
jgi:hypothetical protein